MKTFNQFINETIILEMPHIKLDTGNSVVDLELEVHGNMKRDDFIKYIGDWVSGKEIQSKRAGFSMKVNANSVGEFARKVLKQQYLKNFTIDHYGEDAWVKIEKILQDKL